MSRTPRRRTRGSAGLWILLATFSGLLLGCDREPAEPTPTPEASPPAPEAVAAYAIRMKFQDFVQDQTRLDNLRKAVEVMKSRSTAATSSADYRRSWEYWGAAHSFFGSQSRFGPLPNPSDIPPNKRRFYEGIRNLTFPAQPPGLAAKVWDKCVHGRVQFLTWHRMFLFYFERVLMDASPDKSLRLPYWDYTDPAQVQLPAAFAPEKLNDGSPNPLYDPRRRSQTVKLDPRTTDIDDLLRLTSFNSFTGNLDQQPHGTVHCVVGPDCPYPLMGAVNVSANDPIFWLHHANIDRIFECWLQRGGTVPDSLKGQSYDFLDANGNLVTKTVGDFFSDQSPIDYKYDHVTDCGRKRIPAPRPAPEAVEPPATPLGQVKSVGITDASTSVRLPLATASVENLERSMTDESSRTELVLEDITVADHPGVLFNVYLSTTGPNPRRQYVATLSFFGIEHHDDHGGTIPNRSLDVTEEIQALKGASEELPEIQVVFEATNGTEEATLESVRPLFNRQSGLKVGTIRLNVKGPQ